MTLEIGLVLGLLVFAVVMFLLEWISIDLTTLSLLCALVILGILTPEEAFSGFASDIIIILASVFVLSAAMMKTGVMDFVGSVVNRVAGGSQVRILVCIMGATAFFSAFMNNTTVTAVFLPAALAVCRKSKLSPSKVLIPLAFASMLGGTCTLIGTSTNVAASGLIARTGLEPISLFEFAGIGVIVVVCGIVYMALVGTRLLPDFHHASFAEEYEIDEFLSEIIVSEDSPLAGKTIAKTPLAEMDLTVLAIIRNGRRTLARAGSGLKVGDVLIVKTTRESLLDVKGLEGVEIEPDVSLGDQDLMSDSVKIAEAIVMPKSPLVGRNLRELNFRRRFGATVLAIYRRGHPVAHKLAQMRLHVGDILLLQGPREEFVSIAVDSGLKVLEEVEHVLFRKQKGLYAIGIFLMAMGTTVFGLLPLPVAFLLAAIGVIALGCVSIEQAYEFMEWPLIILIAGMTAFGVAMEKSGTAEFLATSIVGWLEPMGIFAIMGGFVILTLLLTQPMSNAAAALVVLPVAIMTAEQLQVDPRSFAILITLAASLSFITPFEPACLLVYAPGRYRFRDFVISGLPLSILASLILLLLVPIFWPLKA